MATSFMSEISPTIRCIKSISLPAISAAFPACRLSETARAMSPSAKPKPSSPKSLATPSAIFVEDQQFETVKELSIGGAGLAFDPSHDVLYVADPSADVLLAYNTASWTQLFSIPIDEDLQNVDPLDGVGEMAVSDD